MTVKTCKTCSNTSDNVPWKRNYGIVVGFTCQNCKRLKQKAKRTTIEGKLKVSKQNAVQRATEQGKIRANIACNNWHKVQQATNEQYRVNSRIRALITSSLKLKGYSKTTRTYKILGADFETVMKHLGCEAGIPEGYEIDHIIPMALAYDETSAIRLNHYTNFQLLTKAENLEKRDKLPDGRNAGSLLIEQKKELFVQLFGQ